MVYLHLNLNLFFAKTVHKQNLANQVEFLVELLVSFDFKIYILTIDLCIRIFLRIINSLDNFCQNSIISHQFLSD